MKKTRIFVIISPVLLVILPLITPFFIPWSGINCEHQDINIHTGQARYSRSIWFIPISIRTKDTSLSLALQGETVKEENIKAWHRVNTFSFTAKRHSPHYRFHGALSQAEQIRVIFSLYDIPESRKRQIARDILVSWQHSGRYSGADEIISSLDSSLFRTMLLSQPAKSTHL